MKTLELTRVGEHFMDGGLYKDNDGKYYVDCHDAPKDNGISTIYRLSPADDPDGEPSKIIECEIKILNPLSEREKRENEFRFEYMMLSRLESDCRGFLCEGDCRFHNVNNIWGNTTKSHIARMKELWQKFPDDLKPGWCTWEQILEYEKQMCA